VVVVERLVGARVAEVGGEARHHLIEAHPLRRPRVDPLDDEGVPQEITNS
jgi:hypothetical protein